MKTATITKTKAIPNAPAFGMAEPIAPTNAYTLKPYSEPNATVLQHAVASKHFDSHEFATTKQWNRLKRSVAVGERGTAITSWESAVSEGGEIVRQPVTVFVFNRAQLAPLKRATTQQ